MSAYSAHILHDPPPARPRQETPRRGQATSALGHALPLHLRHHPEPPYRGHRRGAHLQQGEHGGGNKLTFIPIVRTYSVIRHLRDFGGKPRAWDELQA